MKCRIAIMVSACGFLSCCGKAPLEARFGAIPSVVSAGQKVMVPVTVSNVSRQPQWMPANTVHDNVAVMNGVFPEFVRTENAEVGVGPIRGVSLSVCPPQHDDMEPGETRCYRFAWIPEKGDLGPGFLRLSALDYFKTPEPIPVTVKP